jgi:hypothetical protein
VPLSLYASERCNYFGSAQHGKDKDNGRIQNHHRIKSKETKVLAALVGPPDINQEYGDCDQNDPDDQVHSWSSHDHNFCIYLPGNANYQQPAASTEAQQRTRIA